MFPYYFSPQIHYLLKPYDNSRVQMHYGATQTWPAPLIELRPPYYAHPQIVPNYPLI